MKLVLSRRAVKRLTEIADYLAERNPAAAQDAQTTIRASLDLLTRFPHVGRLVGHEDKTPNTRVLAVPRRPYLIYYQVDDSAGRVTIIAIRHAAQRRLS